MKANLSVIILVLVIVFSKQSNAQFSGINHFSSFVTSTSDAISGTTAFLTQGGNRLLEEYPDSTSVLPEYDFIIVGGGSAGCVLANRLSENRNWKILLIEAGRRENFIMDIPMFVHYLQVFDTDWHYKTERSNSSCLGMVNNQCKWPRGKVMGGSSVLNYMIYTRGNRRDYDRWAELGNKEWSWKQVHQYFKKLEKSHIPDAAPGYLGKDGPMHVSYPKFRSKIAKAFVKAGIESGAPLVDYNGPTQTGFSYFQTTTVNGERSSANVAYLYTLKKRPNLDVKKETMVTNILIDPVTKTATGVKFLHKGKYYQVRARKEVILSAGAINSPQLLMLSGIGPAQHLLDLNIKPIADLAVGFNLMDHQAAAVPFTVNSSSLMVENVLTVKNYNKYMTNREGPITSIGGCEAVGFYDLQRPGDRDGWPDIELFQVGGPMYADAVYESNFNLKHDMYQSMFRDAEKAKTNGFQVWPMLLRPKSRGRIMLRSSNPLTPPLIYPNYYSHPDDIKTMVGGIRQTIELLKQPALRKLNTKLFDRPVPNCKYLGFNSDKYWDCAARHFTLTIYHYSGTCKMGPRSDPTAVVDSRLRVHGIKKLRVIDASIMPEIPAGHTNGPTLMIAERASDMIKEDYRLINY